MKKFFLSSLLLFCLSHVLHFASADTSPKDPLWAEHIASHSAGLISRHASIRVQFVHDVIEENQVGSAAHLLSSEPPMRGQQFFSSRRELVLTPNQPLPADQFYKMTLNTKGLQGIPESLPAYPFSLRIVRKNFEMNFNGVRIEQQNPASVMLSGVVWTADEEKADDVERLLSLEFAFGALKTAWVHSEDQRQHYFTISNIERQLDSRTRLTLRWDGQPLGLDKKGQQAFEIPAAKAFQIENIEAVDQVNGQPAAQHVRVTFSQLLDPSQDLTGFTQLTLQDKEIPLQSRIEDNLLLLYPTHPLQGTAEMFVSTGISSLEGQRTRQNQQQSLRFDSRPSAVHFVGKGTILPTQQRLTIPFESINAQSVKVHAWQIYADNMGQFLQVNQLDEESELERVGALLWTKKIDLNVTQPNQWQRYWLDATELLSAYPGSLLRLQLEVTPENVDVVCPQSDEAQDEYDWEQRENPCHSAYFYYSEQVRDQRNFLASNIGLTAQRATAVGSEAYVYHVAASDIRTAQPLAELKLDFYNYQNRLLGSQLTDTQGFAQLPLTQEPFYIHAQRENDHGYLKINPTNAMEISHFDVGGVDASDSIQAFMYTERGVWRPGDDIHLSLILQDKLHKLPDNYPLQLQLIDPNDKVVQTLHAAQSAGTRKVNELYYFKLHTSEDAPTGVWTARALLGGKKFDKSLNIKTVMPNRLKIAIQFAHDIWQAEQTNDAKLLVQWLHGAPANELKSQVRLRLSSIKNPFAHQSDAALQHKIKGFVFYDDSREVMGDWQEVVDANLNAQGELDFSLPADVATAAPGMLQAYFEAQVFEKGGAFSTQDATLPLHPYSRYVGLKLPPSDSSEHPALATDKAQKIDLLALNVDGFPVPKANVQVSLYKIDWRWWWDSSQEELARYIDSEYYKPAQQDLVKLDNGKAQWTFEIQGKDAGRYLLRACDTDGGHCASQVTYLEQPGWSAQGEGSGHEAAQVLSFFSDKTQYQVGDTAKIQLPANSQGHALVSIANGQQILQQYWLDLTGERQQFEAPLSLDMVPTAYVSVSLLQAHQDKQNDRPLRMFGVIPLNVDNPDSYLQPKLDMAQEWLPESTVQIAVSEAHQHAMTYTLALVDEGLLSLTNFRLPQPHPYFYRKQALNILTWDLFDLVVGVYNSQLETLLALGGDDSLNNARAKRKRRFPPVVQFLGPFHLDAGATQTHDIQLPAYIGELRAMLVAVQDGAYGQTEQAALVRKPLMVLPTVPRVLSPGDQVRVPLSVFVSEDAHAQPATIAQAVQISIKTNDLFVTPAQPQQTLPIPGKGEHLAFFDLQVQPRLGDGHLAFNAQTPDGSQQAHATIDVPVRSPNPVEHHTYSNTLLANGEKQLDIKPHGLSGSQSVTLEVSTLPPLNLQQRLDYLLQYPHGCGEQITSAVLPQLSLAGLLGLDKDQQKQIQTHTQAALQRLQFFQHDDGGFRFWPEQGEASDPWLSSYIGHFLLLAEQQGYQIPTAVMSRWLKYQTQQARRWVQDREPLMQSYRLYTLALAGQPEIGAMNRLRETWTRLPTVVRWQLAASYSLAGIKEIAQRLVSQTAIQVEDRHDLGTTLGSTLRDQAIVLDALRLLGLDAKGWDVARAMSKTLSSETWLNTHSTAFALSTMANFFIQQHGQTATKPRLEYRLADGALQSLTLANPLQTLQLQDPRSDAPAWERDVPLWLHNPGDSSIYTQLHIAGVPPVGEEVAYEEGLLLAVFYTDVEGNPLDTSKLTQGQDLVAQIAISNKGQDTVEHLALNHAFPAGWEILNARFDSDRLTANDSLDYQDVRDDRIYSYFSLSKGERKHFNVLLNAAYLGRYYQPAVRVEAMYDAHIAAQSAGKWVEVVEARKSAR